MAPGLIQSPGTIYDAIPPLTPRTEREAEFYTLGDGEMLHMTIAANILVAITADDQIFIDRRLIDPRAVRANIERLHAENPEGSVVIQASKKSTNKMLVWVMDASRQAGVYNISIADSST